jgi:hypothetical protein
MCEVPFAERKRIRVSSIRMRTHPITRSSRNTACFVPDEGRGGSFVYAVIDLEYKTISHYDASEM